MTIATFSPEHISPLFPYYHIYHTTHRDILDEVINFPKLKMKISGIDLNSLESKDLNVDVEGWNDESYGIQKNDMILEYQSGDISLNMEEVNLNLNEIKMNGLGIRRQTLLSFFVADFKGHDFIQRKLEKKNWKRNVNCDCLWSLQHMPTHHILIFGHKIHGHDKWDNRQSTTLLGLKTFIIKFSPI
ncbi:hypothetical protein ACJX0J_037444 [Zea mays]